MSSHHLTIEKAKFVASLLKPDVTVISRDQVASFLELLEAVLSRCSTANIQVWSDQPSTDLVMMLNICGELAELQRLAVGQCFGLIEQSRCAREVPGCHEQSTARCH
jgi:hypothetical protein